MTAVPIFAAAFTFASSLTLSIVLSGLREVTRVYYLVYRCFVDMKVHFLACMYGVAFESETY